MHFKPAQITSMQKIHKPGSLLDKYDLRIRSLKNPGQYMEEEEEEVVSMGSVLFFSKDIIYSTIQFYLK